MCVKRHNMQLSQERQQAVPYATNVDEQQMLGARVGCMRRMDSVKRTVVEVWRHVPASKYMHISTLQSYPDRRMTHIG